MPIRAAAAATALAAVLVGAVLGGCAAGTDAEPATQQQPAPASTPAPSSATATDTPAANTGSATAPADVDGSVEATTTAAPDRDSQGEAVTIATTFMRAYAATNLPQDQWWLGIRAFLSPAAAAAYKYTDVANVPVHRVEARGVLDKTATRYRAPVKVKTDDGTYTVVLIRAGGNWLVDRATPPVTP